VVSAGELLHRHPLSPYVGARLAGVVNSTWVRGQCVYNRNRGPIDVQGQLIQREAIRA
jgi:allantoinase